MDSKTYQQRVIIDQINAQNQRLKEFDIQIEHMNRRIDNLEKDINFLSFNTNYPFLFKKVNILDIDDATNMRLGLIKQSDKIRSGIHALNEQKERFIALNYPELMSPKLWIQSVDTSSTANIKRLIKDCQEKSKYALEMARNCFEPQKHMTYINYWRNIYVNNLNKQKELMGCFATATYAIFGYDISKIKFETN